MTSLAARRARMQLEVRDYITRSFACKQVPIENNDNGDIASCRPIYLLAKTTPNQFPLWNLALYIMNKEPATWKSIPPKLQIANARTKLADIINVDGSKS